MLVFVYSKVCGFNLLQPALITESVAGESEKHTVLAGEKLDATTPGQCSTFPKKLEAAG